MDVFAQQHGLDHFTSKAEGGDVPDWLAKFISSLCHFGYCTRRYPRKDHEKDNVKIYNRLGSGRQLAV